MMPEEIRKNGIGIVSTSYWLREIAAQLAEANELSRKSGEQLDKFYNRLNMLLDMAIQYAMKTGMKVD